MAKGKSKAIAAPSPMDSYQAESDVRTLHDAHKIRKDKKRHARAIAHAKTMMQAVSQPMNGETQGEAPGGAGSGPGAVDDMD